MRIRVAAVGKPKLAYARAGVEEYSHRLNKTGRFELLQVREGKPGEESSRLLEVSQGYLRVVLDERGELVDTLSLHKKLLDWELHGEKGVAFLIGGANGHTEELRRRADWLLSLSRFTLQHELALVVLLEQLYRVETLKRGEPYHR
ncbi:MULTISPECIES: 23S rRNA (pseudouridine(1915)-N(3))-methyltransferase RlmH [unclassified Meiothermus]|uniref:23S rRNA (pseudouridine(1915)-N(3))-methyltransferase RlmH n=1 Tax=unclassified Meiothermus TaxID=370471 RepID=UPI000D7CAA34|nr:MULTISPECIES: 23S rRNA (pseudouridine(1915)-N(3))-methyltransferase RlmH [unclassified Meiothermus]PZA08592.1 50S rRNA methyltransferase [Meiothermus sp. Pnk-1]RYM40791.1 23S rRNA (pseudouridine(1915)-N(3))-methyltransferase RlmH [Meiothermus sp. PNK-Is4]